MTLNRQITGANGDNDGNYFAWLLGVNELERARPFRTIIAITQ